MFRELASHIRTTEWVLNQSVQSVQSFPCLYHWPVMSRIASEDDPRFNLDEYTQRWNDREAVSMSVPARNHGDSLTKAPHGVARR